MRLNSNELFKAVRLALTLGVAGSAAIAAQPVLAQDDEAELETITVVGSRIKRTDVETSQPVFVLEREELQRTGMTSVGDILQELTTNGAALNQQFNNGGNGETQISLRNLGSNRTLVLVNGRRWVTGLAGAVDLNTIPLSIIERIEVLKDGASAIYGSDAIGGVINITTRDNYDGAEASAYVGENEEGDGREEAYDFTIGASTDRASALINVSYVKNEPIFAGDREISAVPQFGVPANHPYNCQSSTGPFGRFGVVGLAGTQTLIPGRPGTSASDFRLFSTTTDCYNFAPDNYLKTPQEKTALYAQARYNITDSIAFRTEVVYNERQSDLLLAAQPMTGGTAGASAITLATQIPVNNIYNPFGRLVNRWQFRPIGDPGTTNRNRNFFSDVDTWRFGAGFDGAFDLMDRSFSWDVNYSLTENEQNDTNLGEMNALNIRNGLGASFDADPGPGFVPTCGVAGPNAANPLQGATGLIPGCVPINMFGGQQGFTDAMYNYVIFTGHESAGNRLHNYSANLTGDLFELPAGPLAFAAGYEYRREFGFDSPDAFVSAGQTTGNARQPTSGGFSLDEFFVEFNVPVLKDLTAVQLLEFSVAARWSDYSTFGDTTNAKFGFKWKPIDDLLVRGNWSEGFRAPNVSELFAGSADSFQTVSDPCNQSSFANQSAETQANCRNGIGGVAPVPVGYQQINSQIRTTVGSNPLLTPELADTRTLGIVYSPSYVEGLDIFLDWYEIEMTNVVSSVSGDFVIDQCYINSNLNACALVQRLPTTGDVTDIIAAGLNLSAQTVEGYDFTVSYRFDTEIGKFAINWDNAYFSEYLFQFDATSDIESLQGNYFDRNPYWRLKSNIDVNWSLGDWGATVGARYLSALDEACQDAVDLGAAEVCSDPTRFFDGSPAAENELGETWYFDLQGTWDAPWNARITAGLNNVFDEDPPVSQSTFANSYDPQYETPGRFWYLSYTQKF